jgi:hypothetical protein
MLIEFSGPIICKTEKHFKLHKCYHSSIHAVILEVVLKCSKDIEQIVEINA